MIHFLLVRFIPPKKFSSKMSLFGRLIKVLPGIIWPDYWDNLSADDILARNAGSGTESADIYDEEVPSHHLQTSRQLLKPDDIAASLMHHIAVLLTFGIMSPVVAFAVSSAICLQCWQWLMLMNRFVFKRLLMRESYSNDIEHTKVDSPSPPESGMEMVTAKSPSTVNDRLGFSSRSLIVQEVILSIQRNKNIAGLKSDTTQLLAFSREYEDRDVSLRLLEMSVQDFASLLSLCIMPVIVISCIFFAFFSLDITGDRLGLLPSLWISAIPVAIAMVILIGKKKFRKAA